MADIDWQTFIKDSLIIFIVGIIYLIIVINSIVLVKIFPNTPSKPAITEPEGIFRNQSILDYIFPTDLQLPPYTSYRDARTGQAVAAAVSDDDISRSELTAKQQKAVMEQLTTIANRRNNRLNESDLQAEIQKEAPSGGGINKYKQRGGVASENESCAYQISMKDWADKIHKWAGSFNGNRQYSSFVEWPYSWIVPYDPSKGSWTTWYFKYKIANIILNQNWFARTLMKLVCDQEFWLMVPDWLLFLAFPFSKSLSTNSLLPILPTILGGWLFFVIGPVLGLITLTTIFWGFLPPGLEQFDCNKEKLTPGTVQNASTEGIKNYIKNLSSGCGPGFFGNLGMLVLMILSAWLFIVSIGWYNKPLDLADDNLWGGDFLKPLYQFIDWLGGWFTLILIIITFAIFLRCGGLLFLTGAGSMTIVWITTLFKLLSPLLTSPEGIMEVFGCNKDIIALLLTAIITIRAQQTNLLPQTVTNTMWGVWVILLLAKLIVSIQKFISHKN